MFKIFSYLKILFKKYFGLWEKKTLNKVSIDLSNWSFLSVPFFCVVCCIQKCYPKSVLKNIISYLMEVIYKIIHDFLNNRNISLYLKISLIFFYVNVFSESPRKRYTELSSTEHIFWSLSWTSVLLCSLEKFHFGISDWVRNQQSGSKNIFKRDIYVSIRFFHIIYWLRFQKLST